MTYSSIKYNIIIIRVHIIYNNNNIGNIAMEFICFFLCEFQITRIRAVWANSPFSSFFYMKKNKMFTMTSFVYNTYDSEVIIITYAMMIFNINIITYLTIIY